MAGTRLSNTLWSGAHRRPHEEYSRGRAGPAARISGARPDATDGATCATGREAWVTGFDCGAGAVLHGRDPTDPVDASQSGQSRGGSCPLPCAPIQQRDGKASTTLTRTEQTRAVRRRGALDRDRGSRRVSFAIDAQRRLNTRASARHPDHGGCGRSDRSRYAHLTRSWPRRRRHLRKWRPRRTSQLTCSCSVGHGPTWGV